MSSNSSDINPELYRGIDSAVRVLLFLLLLLPATILYILCVIALSIAKDVSLKMRVVLINVLLPELASVIGTVIDDIGMISGQPVIPCIVAYSFISGQVHASIFVTPLFSVVVYIFLKHGDKKLKWSGIIIYAVIFWVVSIIAGGSFFLLNDVSVVGYCILNSRYTIVLNNIVFFFATLLPLTIGIFIVVSLTILSYCYIKKNTLAVDADTPSPVKKAFSRILIFYTIKMFFILLQPIISVIFIQVRVNGAEPAGFVVTQIFYYAFLKIPFEVLYFLTPVISIAFLKPIRDALKEIWCKKNNAASPSAAQANKDLCLKS